MRTQLPLLFFVFFVFSLTATFSLAEHHDPERIMLKDAKSSIDNGDVSLILDMRTQAGLEDEPRKIPNSILITNNIELKAALEGSNKEDLIITYCT